MDVELWGCRVPPPPPSAAPSNSMQPTKFYSGGDGMWEYFPCPFCYVEVELPVLCTHLQEEHCFDTKNAVCPVCAADLGKDMTAHFTVQHSHMLKRRKPQRDSMTAAVERELPHDLSSSLGASLTKRRGNTSDTSPDPLLLSFISYPSSTDDQEAYSDITRRGGVSFVHAQSLKPSMANQILEHDLKVLSQRAQFFQQMLLSTIF